MMFHQIYLNDKYISIVKNLKKLGVKTFIVMGLSWYFTTRRYKENI